MKHGSGTAKHRPPLVDWSRDPVLCLPRLVFGAALPRVVSVLAVVAALGVARESVAHWLPPAALIAEIEKPANRVRFGITGVTRDPNMPRLLYVRAGHEWEQVPAQERREAAEQWLHLWRGGVPQGIVAVLDDATGRSLVKFDARGRAQLTGANGVRPTAAAEVIEGR